MVRRVTQISPWLGLIPKFSSPITACVIVACRKSSFTTVPLPTAVNALSSRAIANVGAMPSSGDAACAVLPENVIFMPRVAQFTAPSLRATNPKGSPGKLCCDRTMSGLIEINCGSAITAAAPAPFSSEGWNSKTTRPRFGRLSLSPTPMARSVALCPSWPQRWPFPGISDR